MTWLFVPYHCVPESAGSTLACAKDSDDWALKTLARFVTLKGKHSPFNYWLKRCTKDPLISRLYGLILPPLIARRGVDTWIASLADTRVNRSHSPGTNLAPKIAGICGHISPDLSASLDQSSVGSKTSPVICTTDCVKSSQSFKAWVTALRVHCVARRMMERSTSGNDYGSLRLILTVHDLERERERIPTLTVSGNGNRKGSSPTSGDGLTTWAGGPLNPDWLDWLMGYPIGWTASAHWGTPLYLLQSPGHLSSLPEQPDWTNGCWA